MMESKEIYTSAILETPLGVLMVQDRADPYRDEIIKRIRARIEHETNEEKIKRISYLLQTIRTGRFRIPGGLVNGDDREKAGIRETATAESLSHTSPEFIELIRESVIRNIQKELNLTFDRSNIIPIMEFQGISRDHVVCFAKGEGRIELDKQNIAGIGFLESPPTLPVSRTFLSEQTLRIFRHYIRSPQRQSLMPRLQSKIAVDAELLDEWYMTMYRAYLSLSPLRKKTVKKPVYPVFPPNSKTSRK